MNIFDLMIRRSRKHDASDSSSSGGDISDSSSSISDSSSSGGDISDSSSSSVTIPTDYVFYAPLSTDLSELSQYARTISAVGGTPVFETQDDIPCCKLPSSMYLTTSYDSGITSGNHDFTMSIWVKPDASRLNEYEFFFFVGVARSYQVFKMMNARGKVEFDAWGFDNPSNTPVYAGWMHLVGRYTASTRVLDTFVNGEKVHTRTKPSNMNLAGSGQISVGGSSAGYSAQGTEWYADALVYDRALTDAEIVDLASQHDVTFSIEVQDQEFSFYPSYSENKMQVTSVNTPSFEIISGTLPSTISFDTSTGTFSGSAPLDEDHTYQVQVRVTANKSNPATATITLNTYATARIDITSENVTFVRDGSDSFTISYFSDESVTFAVESGYTLPSGITLSGNTFHSDGSTTAGSYTVVVRGTSEHNQTGSTGTFYITVQANVITIDTTSLTFYVSKGVSTKALSYSTTKYSITPVYTLTGTLPSGVTFDTSTGVFTSDGTQSSASTASVSVTVASSTGLSTAGTGTVTIAVEMVAPPVPQDYIWYTPFSESYEEETSGIVGTPNQPSAFSIVSDSRFGGYLQIRKTTSDTKGIEYANTATYMDLSAGNITISLWLRAPYWTQYSQLLCGTRPGDGQNGWVLYKDGSSSDHKLDFRSKQNTNRFTTAVDDGEWHNWIFTRSAEGVWTWYKDGTVDTSGTGDTSSINGSTQNMKVGGGTNWSKQCYCDLAQLRVYDRVLDSDEIDELAHEFDDVPILPTDETKAYPLSSNLKDAKHSSDTDYDLTKPIGTNVSYATDGGITGVVVTGGCLYNTYASGARANGCALSAWVKFQNNPSSSSNLKVFVNGSNSSMHGFWMGYKNGKYVAGISTSTSINTDVSTDVAWHHLLLNYDKTNLKVDLWIDGVKAGTATLNSALSNGAGTVINAIYGDNSNPDNLNDNSTRYADIKYYNRTLSEAEILGLAQEH